MTEGLPAGLDRSSLAAAPALTDAGDGEPPDEEEGSTGGDLADMATCGVAEGEAEGEGEAEAEGEAPPAAAAGEVPAAPASTALGLHCQ
jgi:hypothetical protein